MTCPIWHSWLHLLHDTSHCLSWHRSPQAGPLWTWNVSFPKQVKLKCHFQLFLLAFLEKDNQKLHHSYYAAVVYVEFLEIICYYHIGRFILLSFYLSDIEKLKYRNIQGVDREEGLEFCHTYLCYKQFPYRRFLIEHYSFFFSQWLRIYLN